MNPLLQFTAIALVVASLGSAGCKRNDADAGGTSHPRVAELDPAAAEGARRHASDGRHLREVMHELAERTAFAPTNELPADPESNKAADPRLFAEVEALAGGLAEAAARIGPAAEGVKLFNEDRSAFEAEAATLRRHAQDLEAAARSHNVERMQRTFDRVNASCIGCHSRFRDFAGELGSQPPAAPVPDPSKAAPRGAIR